MRILIAEDDPVSRRVLEATLLKWNHEVIVARDGDEALRVLEQPDAPPLAILDWMMPGKDGVEVCRRVRETLTATPPYLILLTAKTEKEDVVAGLEAGADDYLTKPFARVELRARIEVGARVVGLQKRLADRVDELNQALAERERADASLRLSESRYRHLVENSLGLIFTHDLSGTLLSVNPAVARLLEYEPSELIGRKVSELIDPQHHELFAAYLERIREQSTETGLLQILTKSGEVRTWQYQNSRYEETGRETYVLGHAQDVTALKVAEARLRSLTVTDNLTGLHNQRGFFTLAKQHLKLSRRDRQPFSIIYADMDGLKQVNDTYGHLAGSQALQRIALILKNSFRAADVIARLGGDEFAILVVDMAAENIQIPISHLQTHLRRYNARRSHPFELSLSVGAVCVDPDSDATLEELLTKADQAMYEDKKSKRRLLSAEQDADQQSASSAEHAGESRLKRVS